ncbi:MAG: hypothetical protein L7F77_13040 [Candidatus Magnetominusculus sp. LBB02]|nr:hypothetical protein [Candidatus Magnetominusculus sp. LBB02]
MQSTTKTKGQKVNTKTLAQVITSYAAALEDVKQVEAFVSLFLLSVYKKFGKQTVAEVSRLIADGIKPAISSKPKTSLPKSSLLGRLKTRLQKRRKH